MFLNLVIAGIVGFIILILWILKEVHDCMSTMNQLIKQLAKATNVLHNRLSRLEIILAVDKEKAKKNKTNDE